MRTTPRPRLRRCRPQLQPQRPARSQRPQQLRAQHQRSRQRDNSHTRTSQRGGLRASLLYCCTRNSATPRIWDSLWINCGFTSAGDSQSVQMTAASADASTASGFQVAWFHALEVRFRQSRKVAASALQIPQRNGNPQRQEGPGRHQSRRDGMNQGVRRIHDSLGG
jgi:hypothetical protein